MVLSLGMVGALRQANPKLLIVLDMNDERLKKATAPGRFCRQVSSYLLHLVPSLQLFPRTHVLGSLAL